MKIITYQSSNGNRVNLTQAQIKKLKGREWPRDKKGAEYATVSHGLHDGEPTYSSHEIEEIAMGVNVELSRRAE